MAFQLPPPAYVPKQLDRFYAYFKPRTVAEYASKARNELSRIKDALCLEYDRFSHDMRELDASIMENEEINTETAPARIKKLEGEHAAKLQNNMKRMSYEYRKYRNGATCELKSKTIRLQSAVTMWEETLSQAKEDKKIVLDFEMAHHEAVMLGPSTCCLGLPPLIGIFNS